MFPNRPSFSLFGNANSTIPICFPNFSPTLPFLSATTTTTAALFAKSASLLSKDSFKMSSLSLPPPQLPPLSSSLSIELIRGDQLQMLNLNLQLTENDNVIKEILSTGEQCENVLLLCFSCAGQCFHVVFCSVFKGFSSGDEFSMPSKWQLLCKRANTAEANVRNGIAIRDIKFGEEIIVCDETTIDLASDLIVGDVGEQSLQQFEVTQQELRQTDNNGGYKCDRCGKMFTYAYYKEKHLKYTRCVDRGDRRFRCSLCPRSFEKRDRLRIHVLHVHENHRPHVCSTCGKSFSQSSSLNKHLRVHSGERPYKCLYCSKSFTASSILRTHIRQHSGEKPFQCASCGKSFASHAAHDSHVRRTHQLQQQQQQLQKQEQEQEQQKQQQDSAYRCQVCEKTFANKSHLNFHQQCIHSIPVFE